MYLKALSSYVLVRISLDCCNGFYLALGFSHDERVEMKGNRITKDIEKQNWLIRAKEKSGVEEKI